MLGKTLVTIAAITLSTLAPVTARADDKASASASPSTHHAEAKKAATVKSPSTSHVHKNSKILALQHSAKEALKPGAARGEKAASADSAKAGAKAPAAVPAAVMVPVVVETRRNSHDPRLAVRHARHAASNKANVETKNETKK